MSEAVKRLKKDHELNMKAWPVIFNVIVQLKQGRKVSNASLARIIEFLDCFVLEHHYSLEEALVFVARVRGVDQQDELISKIIIDHLETRSFVENLSETLQVAMTGDEAARVEFADESAGLIDKILRHEADEDAKLFPFMDGLLTEEEDRALLEKTVSKADDEEVYEYFKAQLREIESESMK